MSQIICPGKRGGGSLWEVGRGGPLGPRLLLRPLGLGTFLCSGCGTPAAAARGGSRRTGPAGKTGTGGRVALGLDPPRPWRPRDRGGVLTDPFPYPA